MTLSDGEKLILIMLSEMYDAQAVKGEIDPDFIRAAIFGDHVWAISWKYSGIPFAQKKDDPPEVKETVDILAMWDLVEFAYEHLSDDDKKWLLAETKRSELPCFIGFDGNADRHYDIARFMIEHLDRFSRFQERGMNSHHTVLPGYLRMQSALADYMHSPSPQFPLSKETLAKIIAARQKS